MTNILTVDLEEWFVAENLRENIQFRDWDRMSARVEDNTRKLLELFDTYHVRATFFVLGWIAERHPRIVRQISQAGHEIGCHSYQHRRVDTLDHDEFRRDTLKAVTAIAQATGVTPVGYRAPSWSINSSIPWAFEILAELGFMYDSSIFPIKHDIYGEPSGPKRIFKMNLDNGKSLYEIPASTITLLGKNFPFGGGGYLRHAPFWFTARMMRRINSEDRPVVVYIHPWEIDENHPRIQGLSLFQRFRQYGSIPTLVVKLEKLFREFDFFAARDYIVTNMRKPIGFER
ncbi:MAG: DUF3473 domain-containing protein [Candidatus Zixiibacteriota bacterium]|nr:MAG: DUF3473 domain-containing protein [candidate division Zixibacteria bacterium]